MGVKAEWSSMLTNCGAAMKNALSTYQMLCRGHKYSHKRKSALKIVPYPFTFRGARFD